MKFSLPTSSRSQQYRAILPGAVKRAYMLVVVLFAIASGRGQLTIHAQDITPQIAVLPAAIHTQIDRNPTVSGPVRQIAVVAIGKTKYIAPTAVPAVQSAAIGNSPSGGPAALLAALNAYRSKNGKAGLIWDGKLAAFAQQRADFFHAKNDLDGHAGFIDVVNNHDGFHSMGFWQLGENSAIGQTVGAQALIEDVYGKSPAHNANELSAEFSHVGIGVNGTATNFIFGGRKM